MEEIKQQTNKYAREVSSPEKLSTWTDVTVQELYAYILGLNFLMGLNPKPSIVTGSRKRDHFADLLESRYRRLNSNNYNKTFFADLFFLLANGSRIFPLPLYQILSFVLFSK